INLYYIIMSVVGWYLWSKKPDNTILKVSSIGKYNLIVVTVTGVIITAILGYLMQLYTDASLPYIDSFTTVFALIATYMVVKKKIENWLIWIVADGISIGMYAYKSLYFTSFLFL